MFVVANARDWRRASAVLFERESLFGNPPTRGAERERAATAAASGTDSGSPAGDECQNLVGFNHNAQADQLPSQSRDTSIADSLTTSQRAAVAFAQNQREEVRELGDCSTALQVQGTHQQTFVATPFTKAKRAQSDTDDETWVPGDVAPTQSCFDQGDVRATTVVAQAFTHSGYSNQPAWMTGDRTDCLPASGHGDASSQGIGLAVGCDDTAGTLRSNTRNNSDPRTEAAMHVMHGMAVRRLTPRECERLQGFPDGYTDVTYRNKPAADGPRYKALGNSMAVPVMAWIGKRIAEVEATNG